MFSESILTGINLLLSFVVPDDFANHLKFSGQRTFFSPVNILFISLVKSSYSTTGTKSLNVNFPSPSPNSKPPRDIIFSSKKSPCSSTALTTPWAADNVRAFALFQ